MSQLFNLFSNYVFVPAMLKVNLLLNSFSIYVSVPVILCLTEQSIFYLHFCFQSCCVCFVPLFFYLCFCSRHVVMFLSFSIYVSVRDMLKIFCSVVPIIPFHHSENWGKLTRYKLHLPSHIRKKVLFSTKNIVEDVLRQISSL